MPFDAASSSAYDGLRPADFRATILGRPRRITKGVPMAQIADIVLWPIVKGGYDPTYRPYTRLMEAGRLIDATLAPNERGNLRIKYSCFDWKNKGSASAEPLFRPA